MRILITAGPVYGRLDDNKLVSNRVRGIWAVKFAGYLSSQGHQVTLLVADTMPDDQSISEMAGSPPNRGPVVRNNPDPDIFERFPNAIHVVRHRGFNEYRKICKKAAESHDAAIMAAAVVNWIPVNPVQGKMSTKGYKTGDKINIPFVLAPRVIQEMKDINPDLTLIGCKMLIGSTHEDLVDAAYEGVLLPSRCNVVIANDVKAGLRVKHLVHKDHSVQTFDDDFESFYGALEGIINDEYFTTQHHFEANVASKFPEAAARFDEILDKNRGRFVHPINGDPRVLGALALRTKEGWLCSPREKGEHFTARDAALVRGITKDIDGGWSVQVEGPHKATLNAPLLVRYGDWVGADAVLHLHETLPNAPTLPHAPPGTVRDNMRELGGPDPDLEKGFNIEGHGFVFPLYTKELK